MANGVIETFVILDAETCPTCGVVYGVSRDLLVRRRRDGGNWYCTNGHAMAFKEPEAEKLRKQLERERERSTIYLQRNDQLQAEARDLSNQVRAQKAAKTRLLRRVTNGVCIHCNRSFANVQRHMATKHPNDVQHHP